MFFKYLLIYILFLHFEFYLKILHAIQKILNKDTLRLIFVGFVGFVATSGSVADSGVGSQVEILSKFFIGNNLLLKLLKTFSFVLNNNPKFFQVFVYLQNSLIQLQNYSAYDQHFIMVNILHVYPLKNNR